MEKTSAYIARSGKELPSSGLKEIVDWLGKLWREFPYGTFENGFCGGVVMFTKKESIMGWKPNRSLTL